MSKKLVALVCVAMLCLAMVSEALASGTSGCQHTWVLQNGGHTRVLPYPGSTTLHCLQQYQVKVCTKCGTMGGGTYTPIAGEPREPHVDSGRVYSHHELYTHTYSRICSVCGGYYDTRRLTCGGGDAHVPCPF